MGLRRVARSLARALAPSLAAAGRRGSHRATVPFAEGGDPLSLIAELQRRRVFRALVGYGIATFAVLQIIQPVMHGLHWPVHRARVGGRLRARSAGPAQVGGTRSRPRAGLGPSRAGALLR